MSSPSDGSLGSFIKSKKGIALVVVIVLVLLALIGAIASGSSTNKPVNEDMGGQVSTATQKQQTVTKPVVEEKIEKKTEVIPFTTTTENDSTLTKGQTKLKQEGKNGTREITYKVIYKDGIESSREKVSETVTVQPVTQITLVGTYAPPPEPAPSPTPAPEPSPAPSSPPAGVTAICNDGSYSYSQHRSGTCSHHGGVAQWINRPPS